MQRKEKRKRGQVEGRRRRERVGIVKRSERQGSHGNKETAEEKRGEACSSKACF